MSLEHDRSPRLLDRPPTPKRAALRAAQNQIDGSQAPAYDQFVRTLGWWGRGGLARQDDTLFVVTGYWGVQSIPLQ